MNRKLIATIIVLLLTIFGFSDLIDDSIVNEAAVGQIDTSTQESSDDLYELVRVTDGDTIVVEKSGKEEKIRLIGIDTPELHDGRGGVECFANEAKNKLEEILEGHKIRLELDQSQGERDRYGRLLSFVFRDDNMLVNKFMLQNGFAYEYTYNKPYKYQDDFKRDESYAKENEIGLWSEEFCPTD